MIEQFQSSQLTEIPVVWKSKDGREWKAHEMSLSHLINISRQIMNEIAERLELEPIEIQTQVAPINFYAITWERGMEYLRVFVGEIVRRIYDDPEISPGYLRVWKEMGELAEKIEALRVADPEWFQEQFDWHEPIWGGWDD